MSHQFSVKQPIKGQPGFFKTLANFVSEEEIPKVFRCDRGLLCFRDDGKVFAHTASGLVEVVEPEAPELGPLPLLNVPIDTLEKGKAFIEQLHLEGMMFHFEDSPEDIVNGETGKPLFSPDQFEAINARIEELYALDWPSLNHECPIGYALEVSDREENYPEGYGTKPLPY